MSAPEKVKGPASYFPSIEAKYGQPIEHWLQLVAQRQGMKHMEIVNWLKERIHELPGSKYFAVIQIDHEYY